jgi:CBS domain-containing protein
MPAGASATTIDSNDFPPAFEDAKVADVMRVGIVSCSPETSLTDVARTMAACRIHAVVVRDLDREGERRAWGVISDLDLALAAGPDADETTAGSIARTELVTVSADEPVQRATQLMGEHEVSHLLVMHPQDGRPLGIISTLDIAGVLGWGRAE